MFETMGQNGLESIGDSIASGLNSIAGSAAGGLNSIAWSVVGAALICSLAYVAQPHFLPRPTHMLPSIPGVASVPPQQPSSANGAGGAVL